MQTVQVFPGTRKKPASALSEVQSMQEKVQGLQEAQIFSLLKEVWGFLKDSEESLQVAILKSELQGRYSEDLIQQVKLLPELLGTDLEVCVLPKSLKNAKKKRVFEKLNFAKSRKLVFIEGFEEWGREMTNEVFEVLKDAEGVGVLVDISGDPRNFNVKLDLDLVQCLTIKEFFIPPFKNLAVKALKHSTENLDYVLSCDLFQALLDSPTSAHFLKKFKAAFCLHNQTFKHVSLTEKTRSLKKLKTAKTNWLDSYRKFKLLIKTHPRQYEATNVFKDAYLTEVFQESSTCIEFLGSLRTLTQEEWKVYLENLTSAGILKENQAKEAISNMEKLPLVSNRLQLEQGLMSKTRKWTENYILPLIRKEVVNKISSLPHTTQKLTNSEFLVVEPCSFESPDLMKETLDRLHKPYFGTEIHDTVLVFKTICDQPREIELNYVFDCFCQYAVKSDLNSLQTRFLRACEELRRLGLVVQSNKRKSKHFYATKNFFAISTLYN